VTSLNRRHYSKVHGDLEVSLFQSQFNSLLTSGTCVNVGCIPKKLMHQSGLMRESMDNAGPFGWSSSSREKEVDWYAFN
jgi:pyruvate/2-oxoglutarate dehydrogenase complex dihydrolipoamide dehydrogenase (E3) component